MKVLVAINSVSLLNSLLCVISEIEGIKYMGYVSSAEDATGMINLVKVDVLILEVSLGESSGFDVLAHTRKVAPRIKIIMVTDAPYPEYKNKSMELGADFFFNIANEFQDFHLTLKKLCLESATGPAQVFSQ